jgi:hypothetical protein
MTMIMMKTRCSRVIQDLSIDHICIYKGVKERRMMMSTQIMVRKMLVIFICADKEFKL